MAVKDSLALFLLFNVLFFTLTTATRSTNCPPPPRKHNKHKPSPPTTPTTTGTCPKDTLKLGVCVNALNLLNDVTLGTPPVTPYKPLPRAPQNDAASGSKSKKPKSTQAHLVRKPNSIQKPSPTVLSVNDKNRAWEEKSRGKRRIASSMETRGGPALYNRFAALDSLEDAG
ncbi:unnamed protein product [Brassica oleracea var. botrytis]